MDSNIEGVHQSIQKRHPTGRKEDMDKDTFLKLMMIQMRHQDPLAPMDNSQMLAQMAQFTSLEQMSKLNSNFESSAAVNHFMNATQLIGKKVAILDPTAPPDNPKAIVSPVESVSSTEQGAILHLKGGFMATMDDIVWVGEPGQNPGQVADGPEEAVSGNNEAAI